MIKRFSFLLAALLLPTFSTAQTQLISGFNFGQFLFEGYPSVDGVEFLESGSIPANWKAGDDGAPPIESSGVPNFPETPYDNGTGDLYWNGTNGSTSEVHPDVAVLFRGSNSVGARQIDGSLQVMSLVGDAQSGAQMQFAAGGKIAFVINTTGYVDFVGSGAVADVAEDGISDNLTFSAFAVSSAATIEWFLGESTTAFATTTVSASVETAHSVDLPAGFYGSSAARLVAAISGGTGVVIDNVQFNGTVSTGGTPPVITSALTASGTVGEAFSYQISATESPTSYDASPLPNGLSVNTTTGLISGTPTAAGATVTSISATNASGTGSANLTITISEATTAPSFTTHPSNLTITAGGNASFTVAASGNPAPTFTWQYNSGGGWTALGAALGSATVSGQTTASVTLTGVPSSLTGYQFRALASNSVQANVASNAATLTVNTPVTIPNDKQPQPRTITAGGSTTFTVEPTGTTPFTYTWESRPSSSGTFTVITGPTLGGATVSGETTATLSLASVPEALNGYEFRALVSNPATTDFVSATAALTVNPVVLNPPVITSPLTASGTINQVFSYQIAATNSPTTFGATGLPNGLAVNTTTGAISGTPTASGVTPVTITATNADGSDTETLTITIAAGPTPVITSPLTASGTVGQVFSYQITATESPTSFSAAPLPAGLSVNTTTGAITGTPTEMGVTNVAVNGTNANGPGVNSTLVITIAPPSAPVVTNPQLASGRVGQVFSYQIEATYAESFGIGPLPDGLSLNVGTGVISGTPTQATDVPVAISATNSLGTTNATLLLTILPQAPVIDDLPAEIVIQVNEPYTLDVNASNSPTSITANTLPSGLSINTATGVVSGTPTTVGDTTTTFTATNDGGQDTEAVVFRVVSYPTENTFFKLQNTAGVSACLFARADRTGIFLAYDALTDDVIAERRVTFASDWTFSFVVADTVTSGEGEAAPISVSGSVTGVAATFTMTGLDGNLTANRVSGSGTGSLQTLFMLGEVGGTVYAVVFPDGSVQAYLDGAGYQDFGYAASSAGGVAVTTLEGNLLATQSGANGLVTGTLTVPGAAASALGFSAAALPPGVIQLAGIGAGEEPARNLVNLSGRSYVNGAGSPAICGFVIEGTQPAKLLVRAAGPALTPFQVNGVLADPQITVYNKAGMPVASNDNWSAGTPQEQDEVRDLATAVGAFSFAVGSADAALVLTLEPGSYTAVASGTGASDTGVALVEVYDSNTEGDSGRVHLLVNSSIRAWIATGDGVTNAGFVIRGDSPKKVLIRAVGPELARFQVPSPLADPVLSIYDRADNEKTAENDDWTASPHLATIKAAAASVGAFELAEPSADSVVLITLMPGEYTAIVSGKAGAMGNALLEVYEVQD